MRTVEPVTPRLRQEPRRTDLHAIAELVRATRLFSSCEQDIAVELLREFLARGKSSGYQFLFLDLDGEVIGYTCFGPIPCTVASFDLYWIVVAPSHQGRGFGGEMLRRTEEAVCGQHGRRLYVETSGRADYRATREFYQRAGYRVAATLPDFYRPGDDKVIFVKVLEQLRGARDR